MKILNFISLAFTMHIPSTLAAASGTPGVGADLDKQYRINFASTNTGGCQGFDALLRSSYEEAFQAAGSALDALKIIKGPQPDGSDAAALAKWRRIARVFSALFGAGEATFRARSRFNAVDGARGKYQFLV
jgi:hypothetical protein